MMYGMPSKEQLENSRNAARSLNDALDTHGSLQVLRDKNIINITINKEGHTQLGHNLDEVSSWYSKALDQIDEVIKSDNKRFRCGNVGSVWFDVVVTANNKTKKVRVYLAGAGIVCGGYRCIVGLDATFDEKW